MGVIKATVLTHPGAKHGAAHNHVVFGSTLSMLLAFLSLALTVYTSEPNPIPLMLGALCFLLILWAPWVFFWPSRLWKAIWIGLGHLVIFLVWVLYILPSGLIMQARGRDPLDLRFRPEARTYWKNPHPTGNMQKST